MSEQLQDMALKMVIDFASTTILQNATKPMGKYKKIFLFNKMKA